MPKAISKNNVIADACEENDPELLVARYKHRPNPDLKDQITAAYSKTVERIARRFAGLMAPQDDLEQVGFIGLLNALNKFDPSSGIRFNTYAPYLIAGEIKHYLRDRAATIRQPAWIQEIRNKVTKATGRLHVELGRAPTNLEIAERAGVSEQDVREAERIKAITKVTSLDTGRGIDQNDEEDSQYDGLACSGGEEELAIEDSVVLERVISEKLTAKERQAFGLFYIEELNQTEIAKIMQISANYVGHLIRFAKGKIRDALGAAEASDRALVSEYGENPNEICDDLGVYKAEYLPKALKGEMHRASCEDKSIALVLIDFSGFERSAAFYADTYENFSVDFTARLRADLPRHQSILTHYGEYGFAIILPAKDHELHAKHGKLLASLLDSVEKTTKGQIKPWMALAFAPQDGKDSDQIMSIAAGRLAEAGMGIRTNLLAHPALYQLAA